MPVNGYSVGRDLTLNINTQTGALIVRKITRFQSKQETRELKVMGLDGITDHAILPDCWGGDMDVERRDSVLDDYFAQLEADYYAGLNLAQSTITETIREANGKISQYRYTGVQFKLASAGEWSGADTVKQRLDWVASRRIKVL
jgi:hypothetical protein